MKLLRSVFSGMLSECLLISNAKILSLIRIQSTECGTIQDPNHMLTCRSEEKKVAIAVAQSAGAKIHHIPTLTSSSVAIKRARVERGEDM